MRKLIRESVLKIEQYKPGKPAEVLKRELALRGEICQLASNENSMGPSPLALRAIKTRLKETHLYPDNSCYHLKNRLARHLGVLPENLKIGNGSSDLILLLGLAVLNPQDTLIMSRSSFIFAKILTQIFNCHLVEVPLKDYRHDLDAILESVTPSTKIVYLDNPMNPIGTMTTHQVMSRFMRKLPEGIIVVLDEAYHDFVNDGDYPKSWNFVEEGKNVVLLRTFSKMYGLAGFRVGYGVAKKEFIHVLDKVSSPFSVNRLGQIGAAAALDDKDHVERTRQMNERGKEYLYRGFEECGIFYIPSETNFVTFDVKTDSQPLADDLQKKGIIVRPLSMYGLPTFLRVTIGSPEQNKIFMDTFKMIYKKKAADP